MDIELEKTIAEASLSVVSPAPPLGKNLPKVCLSSAFFPYFFLLSVVLLLLSILILIVISLFSPVNRRLCEFPKLEKLTISQFESRKPLFQTK